MLDNTWPLKTFLENVVVPRIMKRTTIETIGPDVPAILDPKLRSML